MKKFSNKAEMLTAFPSLGEGERFELLGEIFEKRGSKITKPGYKDPGKISQPEPGRFSKTATGYCPKTGGEDDDD